VHDRFRHLTLGGWSDLVCRRPKAVLILAVLIALACAIGTYNRLTFQSDRNALISENIPWNKLFIDWVASFDAANELVIVIDAGLETDQQAGARQLVDELGPMLAADPHIKRALWGFDPAALNPRALRIAPMDQFEQQLAEIQHSGPLLAGGTPAQLLATIGSEMRSQADNSADLSEPDTLAQLDRLHNITRAISEAVTTPLDQPVDFDQLFMGDAAIQGLQYLESENGRLLFITLVPKRDLQLLNPLAPTIASIRRTLDDVAGRYPKISIGLTGIEVIESDETDAATADSTRSSIVALLLIALLLVTAFHSVRLPLILLASLAVGIAWAFGYLTMRIGHLQVLSVVFTVILMGLGVDYGIHLIAGFELVRHKHEEGPAGFLSAMRESFENAGPGIITGAVTSAAAFLTTLFTDFTGVAEMGEIAGVGVLLCLLAMATVFPALLRLVKSRKKHIALMEDRFVHFYEDRWVMPFVRHPRVTLVVAGLVFVVSSTIALTQMRFDFDLLKLLPTGIASVDTARLVTEEGGTSIWYGVSTVKDLEEARELAAKYRAQPNIAPSLGGVGLFMPQDEPAKIARLKQVRKQLGPLLDQHQNGSPPGNAIKQLSALRLFITFATMRDMPDKVRDQLKAIGRTMDMAINTANRMTPEKRRAHLDRLNQLYRDFRDTTLKHIRSALDTRPMTLDDFPADLLASYQDDQGRLAMLIFPQLPDDGQFASAMDPRFLPLFVDDMMAVDKNVTGNAPQFYQSGVLIRDAYLKAGLLALILVFLIVMIDFHSAFEAALSLLPVSIGFAVTFAVMWGIGMQINPANIMVLPLMFGLGVDAGVHVLHRYRQSPQQDPPGLSAGTGKGITITVMTTMIGFGSLMLASHRGIYSLGFVMTVGLGCTLLACWIVMPAVLSLRRQSG